MSALLDIVKEMAVKQRHLKEALSATTLNATQASGPVRSTPSWNDDVKCYICRQPGHFACHCRRRRKPAPRSNKGLIQCHSCQGFGYVARNCANNAPLNEHGGGLTSGNDPHLSILTNSTMPKNIRIPTRPFLKCTVEGVNVHALVETGSMKTLLRKDIHNTIDFEGTRIDTADE